MDSNNSPESSSSPKDASVESMDTLVDEDDEQQQQQEDSKMPAVAAATADTAIDVDSSSSSDNESSAHQNLKAAPPPVAAAAAAATTEILDLCDSSDEDNDDDDDDSESSPESVSDNNNDRKRKAKAYPPPAAAAAAPEVLDLCGSSDDDDDDEAMGKEYMKTVVEESMKSSNNNNNNTPHERARKRPAVAAAAAAAAAASSSNGTTTTSTSTNDGPDAIEIDIDDHDDSKKPAAKKVSSFEQATAEYRKVLGPIRMDFVDQFQGNKHAHVNAKGTAVDTKNLYKELVEYKLNLPIEVSSSIFVRVLQSRLALMRALITGPEDTPYANGCFLFDLFAGDYPHKPPQVKFLTTGQGRVRFNPNLYNCGKVCLSLLGTWQGPGWESNKSTLLQVLVSIQGLILVPDPFFNEPGYASTKGKPHGEKQSRQYTLRIRHYTLEHAIGAFLQQAVTASSSAGSSDGGGTGTGTLIIKDYPEFTSIIVNHFLQRANVIDEQITQWNKEDKTLTAVATRVRTNLHTLVQMHASMAADESSAAESAAASAAPPAAAAAATAKKAAPETIDLC